MLVRLIVAIVIFCVVRFFASLYFTRAVIYNLVATGAVAVFVLALWAHGAWYRSQLPAAATQAAAPAGQAVRPPPITLSQDEVNRLTSGPGSPSLAAVDAITMSATLNDAPPGNIVRSGSHFFVRGWAASAAMTPFQGLVIVIDHRIVIDATPRYGGPRPDVAKAYNAASMTYTGFSSVAVPTTGLQRGAHVLQIGGLSEDRKHYNLAPVTVTFSVE